MAPNDATQTADIMIKLDETNTASTGYVFEQEPSKEKLYKRIGDMVYFRDIDRAIPIRKLSKQMRKDMGL